MDKFYYVLSTTKTSEELNFELKNLSIGQYGCLGVQELGMIESEVDELLGSDAYCGGEIPDKVLEKIEDLVGENQGRQYFFDNEENCKKFKDYLEKNSIEHTLAKEKIEDWNTEWKKHFRPIEVNEDFYVVPVWEKENVSVETKIIINPGMGFGTGTHETTFLCLKLFYDLIKNEKLNNCLDLGCGSGILGIAFNHFVNNNVCYCDIDKEALDNCVENIRLNFEGKDLSGTSIVLRDRLVNEKYDLVFANILEDALLAEKKTILENMSDSGFVILSGLLNEQVPNIISAYNELELLEHLKKGDWSALLMRKRV